MSKLFERLEVRFTPLAEAKGLRVVFDYTEQVLLTDPILLERILDNLIANAIRYTSSGKIRISAKKSEQEIIISVSDTGPGIPSQEQKNIFNEFHQLHNPERDRSKGLGLGLSIVKRLSKILNHRLELESYLGKGSNFRVHVPTGDPCKLLISDNTPQRPVWDLKDTMILVIDDEADVRDAMHELLTSWGCRAICADSADEAVKLVTNGTTPDLIIADYRLRNSKNGVDAIRVVTQALNVAIPGMLITGDTAPERLQEAASSGFKLLHKPVNAGQLRVVINRLLSQHRQQCA